MYNVQQRMDLLQIIRGRPHRQEARRRRTVNLWRTRLRTVMLVCSVYVCMCLYAYQKKSGTIFDCALSTNCVMHT